MEVPAFLAESFFEVATQFLRPSRMAHLSQRIGFDPSNTLTGHIELFADFL
jgi:hypothetical protein